MFRHFIRAIALYIFMTLSTEAAFAMSEEQNFIDKIEALVLNSDGKDTFKFSNWYSTKETSLLVDFGQGPEILEVKADWEYLGVMYTVQGWRWAYFRTEKTFIPEFIYEEGTFKASYIYINSVKKEIPIHFTFKTDAVRRLAPKKIEEVSKIQIQEIQKPVLNINDLFIQNSLIDEDVFLSMESSSEEESQDSNVDERIYEKKTVRKWGIRGLLKSLKFVYQAIEFTTDQYDHLWTTGVTGTQGFMHVYEGCTSFNPFTAGYGLVEMAVAVKSGYRAYSEYNSGSSMHAEVLAKKITSSAKQIEEYSSATQELLLTMHQSLSIADSSLKDITETHSQMSKVLENAGQEQKEELENILAIYQAAIKEGEFLTEAFVEFSLNKMNLTNGWSEVKSIFENLKDVLNTPFDSSKGKEQFESVMILVQEDITKIEKLLNSLVEPMEMQNKLAQSVNEIKKKQDQLLVEATARLIVFIKKNMKDNEDLKKMVQSMSAQLKCAENTIKDLSDYIKVCEETIGEMKSKSIEIQGDSEVLRKEVASMYKMRHVLLAAGVAFFCPVGGAVGALVVGLGTLQTCDSISRLESVRNAKKDVKAKFNELFNCSHTK